MKRKANPPPLRLTLTDYSRKLSEYRELRANRVDLERMAPRGKGPVLLLPGLLNSDAFMRPLKKFLTAQGYEVHDWQGGVNTGFRKTTAAHLKKRLHEVHAQSGGRKVALVGHSLGGVYARELAREFPGKVSKIVTLCGPFGTGGDLRHVAAPIRLIFKASSSGNPLAADEAVLRRTLALPPVPATSIYSRADEIIDWRACLNPKGAKAENVEVESSHAGMIVNWAAFLVVADRLAEDENNWRPFDPARYPQGRKSPRRHQGETPDEPDPRSFAGAPKLFP